MPLGVWVWVVFDFSLMDPWAGWLKLAHQDQGRDGCGTASRYSEP